MKIASLLLRAFIIIFVSKSVAEDNYCADRSVDLTEKRQAVIECQCGDLLSNIEATLPNGMRLTAACNLHTYDTSGRPQKVALSKTRITLDATSSISGEIYISGDVTLSGNVYIKLNDLGETQNYFVPNTIEIQKKTIFSNKFKSIGVGSLEGKDSFYIEEYTKKLYDPSSTKTYCYTANTKIRILDVQVSLGDGAYDGSGAFLSKGQLLALEPYKPCSTQ